jgi:threonine dehydrogenase-like Zn-dependent dehydrogenase
MRGVVFTGDSTLELVEFPDPTPGPRDVVLEIKASGMCGSDLKLYRPPVRPSRRSDWSTAASR